MNIPKTRNLGAKASDKTVLYFGGFMFLIVALFIGYLLYQGGAFGGVTKSISTSGGGGGAVVTAPASCATLQKGQPQGSAVTGYLNPSSGVVTYQAATVNLTAAAPGQSSPSVKGVLYTTGTSTPNTINGTIPCGSTLAVAFAGYSLGTTFYTAALPINGNGTVGTVAWSVPGGTNLPKEAALQTISVGNWTGAVNPLATGVTNGGTVIAGGTINKVVLTVTGGQGTYGYSIPSGIPGVQPQNGGMIIALDYNSPAWSSTSPPVVQTTSGAVLPKVSYTGGSMPGSNTLSGSGKSFTTVYFLAPPVQWGQTVQYQITGTTSSSYAENEPIGVSLADAGPHLQFSGLNGAVNYTIQEANPTAPSTDLGEPEIAGTNTVYNSLVEAGWPIQICFSKGCDTGAHGSV